MSLSLPCETRLAAGCWSKLAAILRRFAFKINPSAAIFSYLTEPSQGLEWANMLRNQRSPAIRAPRRHRIPQTDPDQPKPESRYERPNLLRRSADPHPASRQLSGRGPELGPHAEGIRVHLLCGRHARDYGLAGSEGAHPQHPRSDRGLHGLG